MFDLIEEELSKKKEVAQEGAVFNEEQNPIYTMPATFRRQAPKASGGKLMVIIFGSLFFLAVIGTGVFLFISSQKQPPAQQVQQPPTETVQEQQAPEEQAAVAPEQQAPTQEEKEGEKQTAQGEQPVQEPQQAETQKTAPVLGVDTDQDGLTDVEERLFATDENKVDSDADGFSDGSELKGLYDPTKPEARLDVSGIVNTYVNQTFKYSLLYPSSWVAKAVERTDREVMISSASGEFFTISAQDNPNKLSPVDWYTTVASPGGDSSRMQSFAYDTWSGVMTEDSLTVYLIRNDKNPQTQTLMYVIKYNLNTKNELALMATFQMLLRSFLFTDLSFVK
jgi:cytoskeletal protein RodZ